MDSVKLRLLLPKVISTVKSVGQWILSERSSSFSKDKVEIKGLNDLVSYVDKVSEKRLVQELDEHFSCGFIVEENSIARKGDYNWIVDPLDGTTNFVHGIPCYSISVALEYRGEVILGVVYEITRDECFSAVKGGGSYLNSKSIYTSAARELKDCLIATGFPIYNFSRMESYLRTLEQLMKNTHGIRRIGSAATDLCYVACGRVDAFFEYNLNAWDVAAGALIVKEAGGKVSDFKGGEDWLFGKEIVASNSVVNTAFASLIRSGFKV